MKRAKSVFPIGAYAAPMMDVLAFGQESFLCLSQEGSFEELNPIDDFEW